MAFNPSPQRRVAGDENAGVNIVYSRGPDQILIQGWYDGSYMAFPSVTTTLREFLDRIGVTEEDCTKAFQSWGKVVGGPPPPEITITPADIDTHRDWTGTGAFGTHEAEIAARWIVEFCQYHNSWSPFRKDEIEEFWRRWSGRMTGEGTFGFCCLILQCDTDPFHRDLPGKEPYIEEKDGYYHLTPAFVDRAYERFPAK